MLNENEPIIVHIMLGLRPSRRRGPEYARVIERLVASANYLASISGDGSGCGAWADEHHFAELADAVEQIANITRRARACHSRKDGGS